MLKKWMLGLSLLSTSLFSQAALITKDVYSVDMVGIEVTAYFDNDTSQTLIWSTQPLINATTAGVANGDWSLFLDGNTFGDYDDHGDGDDNTGTFYGLWTLTNTADNNLLIGLSIDAGMKGFYFDKLEGTDPSTPGSEAGRPYASDDDTTVATYDNPYSLPDLFGILNIRWSQIPVNGEGPSSALINGLSTGESLNFLTDTDRATVPEPTSIAMLSIGLLAMSRLRKKSAGK